MTSIQQLILAICIASNSANIYGAVIITATEKPEGVFFQGFGSLDTSELQVHPTPLLALFSGLYGTPPVVEVGPPNSRVQAFIGETLIGPKVIGALDSFKKSDRGEGDFFGVTFSLPVSSATPAIVVPRNYVSGTALSGSAEYRGESFATLGITPGIYTWKWGTVDRTDSLTVRIGIPEPETLVLALAAALFMVAMRKRICYGERGSSTLY